MREESLRTGIVAGYAPTLERYVQIGRAAGQVISVAFPPEPDPDARESDPLLERILAYLEGTEDRFDDVDIALTVTGPHRDVLEACRSIPYGEQVTAEQVARMAPGLDPDTDGSIVEAALAENPVPILVPDHRVVGVAGGTPASVRRALIALETA